MEVETLTTTERQRVGIARATVWSLYGIYAYVAFIVLALLTLIAVIVTPGLTCRRWITRTMSSLFFTVAGMPIRVRGIEHLPQGQCVIVANHASYLDGPVMTAVLPPRFGFVIKREMESVPLAGMLLRRIGSQFVERFHRHKSASDARRVLRSATNGQSMVFFPEGTFSSRPGLLKFHTGAFVTAARAGCPVVPAVIRGTRTALPSTSICPRPSRIEVEFLPPLVSEAKDTNEIALDLRDRSRAAILSRLHEPDLAATSESAGAEPATCFDDTDRRPRTEHE